MGRISLPLVGLIACRGVLTTTLILYRPISPIAHFPNLCRPISGAQWQRRPRTSPISTRTFVGAMSMPPQKTAAMGRRHRGPNPSIIRPVRPTRSFSARRRRACWRAGLEPRTSIHSRSAFACAPRVGFLSNNEVAPGRRGTAAGGDLRCRHHGGRCTLEMTSAGPDRPAEVYHRE
jgi:hypothetical protein